MAKRIYINRDQKKQLEGFEDVIDLVADPKNVKELTAKEKKQREEDTYGLVGTLENEVKRLELIDQFLSEKIINRNKYSQTRQLIEEELALREKICFQLLDELTPLDSVLQHNLGPIFNKAFTIKPKS